MPYLLRLLAISLLLSLLANCAEPSNLHVSVSNPDGSVAKASVILDPSENTQYTDEDGVATFNDIVPRDYRLLVTHPNYGSADVLVSMLEDETTNARVTLPFTDNRSPEIFHVNVGGGSFNGSIPLGNVIFFDVAAGDDRNDPADLTVTWESNLDGQFFSGPLGADGSLIVEYDGLSAGNHRLVLRVTDTDGLSTEEPVDIMVERPRQVPRIVSVTKAGDGLRVEWERWEESGNFELSVWRSDRLWFNDEPVFTTSSRDTTVITDRAFPYNADLNYSITIESSEWLRDHSESNYFARVDLPAIRLGNQPSRMRVDKKRPALYATDSWTGNLLFINTETLRVEDELTLGTDGASYALHPNGDTLYAITGDGDQLAVIDLATRTTARTIQLPEDIFWINDIAFLQGGYLVVYSDNLHLIDLGAGARLDTKEGHYSSFSTLPDQSAVLAATDDFDPMIERIVVANGRISVAAISDRLTSYSQRIILSGDGKVLAYDNQLLRTADLAKVGVTEESILALNYDGSRGIGWHREWNTVTFTPLGPARVTPHTSAYDAANGLLYGATDSENSIFVYPF